MGLGASDIAAGCRQWLGLMVATTGGSGCLRLASMAARRSWPSAIATG
jgi:hypothetical protein